MNLGDLTANALGLTLPVTTNVTNNTLAGDIDGGFYGPQGAEVAGVWSASQEYNFAATVPFIGAINQDAKVNFIGGFGAKKQ